MATLERDRVSAQPGSGILRPLVRQGDLVAFAIAGAVVVVAFGLVLSRTGTVVHFELQLDQWFSRAHMPALTTTALAINWLFGPPRAAALAVLIALALLWRSRHVRPALTFVAVVGIGWLASAVLKLVVARPRPDASALANPFLPTPSDFSFPSGHTMFAASMAVALLLAARGTRWFGVALILGSAGSVVVALSRVYLGVHYPSDTLASLILAPSLGIVVVAVIHRAGSQGPRLEQGR